MSLVAAGEPVDTGRWSVSLLDAKFGTKSGASSEKPEQLQVQLEITNRSAETSSAIMQLLALANAPAGLEQPTFTLVRDNAILFGLHPGMPERVIATWDWPQGSAPPQSVEFSIASQIHKRRDNLYGAPGWFDRDPVAVVTLAVGSSP